MADEHRDDEHRDGEPPEGGSLRRARTVDALLFLFALLVWAQNLWSVRAGVNAYIPSFLVGPDLALGLAACLALWWRRRFPVQVALLTGAVAALSVSALGALLVALVGVAVYRPLRWSLPVVLLATVLAVPWALLVPEGAFAVVGTLVMATAVMWACLGWGVAIRARRQLVARLREDVRRERRERERRLEGARADERRRIAREMHDVVAHRMSLLSVHAGALAYRTERAEAGRAAPLDPAEIGDAVRVIRDNAHLALDELGDILTVLRSGDTGPAAGEDPTGTAAPQPGLADLTRLVQESVAAGQRVGLALEVPEGAEPAGQVRRTAYRVVQEGLTNTRKHAPGARVEVEVRGGPGRGLEVVVANALPVGVAATEIPGAGEGLTGLAERVALDGGRLAHGPEAGRFRLAATLPWPADAPADPPARMP
ncbi:signal transduction histidine kinase [Nocardiopsis sp. Huas11]|uniref:sensor histidine kinase n=1 Tax=Nocardiopsis sp. Huas11 TaxID=2183912 RepID=UPI000EB0CB50|nr:sensor histidine kinase [Nocardiopsis sp. Huas11]RKS04716.1 signal transduction histidine kinase [Nocardiopsis sp. Huas11]